MKIKDRRDIKIIHRAEEGTIKKHKNLRLFTKLFENLWKISSDDEKI
jgi:hypothetical protein